MLVVASATVVPSMTTMISAYGAESQKGAVMGVFRALGALARALGPLTASAGLYSTVYYFSASVQILGYFSGGGWT